LGFSVLDVMFGQRTTEDVSHPRSRISRPSVQFIHTTIRARAIDPEAKRVETDAARSRRTAGLDAAIRSALNRVTCSWTVNTATLGS
jgi:hypothetical protein